MGSLTHRGPSATFDYISKNIDKVEKGKRTGQILGDGSGQSNT